jgi:hypothetical protein
MSAAGGKRVELGWLVREIGTDWHASGMRSLLSTEPRLLEDEESSRRPTAAFQGREHRSRPRNRSGRRALADRTDRDLAWQGNGRQCVQLLVAAVSGFFAAVFWVILRPFAVGLAWAAFRRRQAAFIALLIAFFSASVRARRLPLPLPRLVGAEPTNAAKALLRASTSACLRSISR